MKIKALKFLTLASILIFASCNECNDCETNKKIVIEEREDCREELETLKNYLDKPFEYNEDIPVDFDYCLFDPKGESVLIDNNYNRLTGIAHFTIPIPKGSNLKFSEFENDTLHYICDGNGKVMYSSENLIFEHETVTSLERNINKSLWVTVTYRNFDGTDCDGVNILQEKKKTSEIEGEPFRGSQKD